VLFHARVAEELPADERFTIDDVAGDLVAKLVRRHPHVFGAAGDAPPLLSSDDVEQSWERLKASEKHRESLTDGIPSAQPALAYAAALVERANRGGLAVEVPAVEDEIGRELFALVGRAVAAGVDPETALRQTARAYRDAIRRAEKPEDGGNPGDSENSENPARP
jgi:XTP/dITP diphosphohydrolase